MCEYCENSLTGRQKRFCSSKCKNTFHNATTQAYEKQRDRGRKRRMQAINELGGKCVECGYNRNAAALSFHHLGDKEFSLDTRRFANCSWKKLREELAKCILLCANCHMEIHHPQYVMIQSFALNH